MRIHIFKLALFAICIGLPINLFGQQVQTQKEQPLDFWEIRKTLIFRSPKRESDAELNEKLIAEIQRRKVRFILSEEDEKNLKKIAGSDSLIKAIRENLPKEVEEMIILYKKYIDNYNGTVEQVRIAIEAAKEFVKKYGEDKELKEVIDYLKESIPILGTFIEDSNDVSSKLFNNFPRRYSI